MELTSATCCICWASLITGLEHSYIALTHVLRVGVNSFFHMSIFTCWSIVCKGLSQSRRGQLTPAGHCSSAPARYGCSRSSIPTGFLPVHQLAFPYFPFHLSSISCIKHCIIVMQDRERGLAWLEKKRTCNHPKDIVISLLIFIWVRFVN
jgi:hypothetical protein